MAPVTAGGAKDVHSRSRNTGDSRRSEKPIARIKLLWVVSVVYGPKIVLAKLCFFFNVRAVVGHVGWGGASMFMSKRS